MIYELLKPTRQYILVSLDGFDDSRGHRACTRRQQYARDDIFFARQHPATRLWLVNRQLYTETGRSGLFGWICNIFTFRSSIVLSNFAKIMPLKVRKRIRYIWVASLAWLTSIEDTISGSLPNLKRVEYTYQLIRGGRGAHLLLLDKLKISHHLKHLEFESVSTPQVNLDLLE